MRLVYVSLVTSLAAACGSSPSIEPDASVGSDAVPVDTVPPVVDYDTGTWQSQVAVDSAGTISHDAHGVFTSDGTLWGSVMEPDVDATSGEDIWEMRLPPGGSWAIERLTDDGRAQAAFNHMATDGTTLHLVYNSRTGADNDVYYTKRTAAGAWSTRLDVTTPDEAPARHDFGTAVAVAPDGGAVIAYVSASVTASGGIAQDGEIRVVRIAADGTVSGAPQVAIPTVAPHGCYDPSVVVAADGTVHVAADCGTVGAEEILYTEDSAGTFAAPAAFSGGAGRDDHGVTLALGPDRATVHAVWTGNDGDADCLYARKPASGTWSEGLSASNDGTGNEHACTLAVDADGNVLTAWHRPTNGNEDIYFAWSPDGVTFGAPRLVTPGTESTVEWFPDVIAVDPTTGIVHILYGHIVPMTDPLNTQILHARLVPN